jgi:hypothetical protein
LTGNEVAFVIVADEDDEAVDFFACDPDEGFQLQLPHGAYSFLAFLVDEDDQNPFDSRVHAAGFAGLTRLNTGGRRQLNLVVDQTLDPPWWLSDLLGVESDDNGYTDEDE